MNAPEEYVAKIIGMQTQLYAYILALLSNGDAADDVLQETNLVLCRKADHFEKGTSFEAWAFCIARTQCFAYWKTRSRDRLELDDAVIAQLASRAEELLASSDDRVVALRECLGAMPAQHRELLESRYELGGSVKRLARRLGRAEGTISQSLYRIRLALFDCVRSRLAKLDAATKTLLQ